MPPKFSIDVDTALDLVKMTMSGFFQLDDIARFRVARAAAHEALKCRPNQHVTLLDIRDMDMQSHASVSAFGDVLSDRCYIARRIAVVVSKSLTRLQMHRAAGGRDVTYFSDDIEAAERWLLTGSVALE